MENEDQPGSGLFLLELNRHTEKLLKDNNNTATQAHQQRTIAFFSPITSTHATSQSRPTQHSNTVTLDQALEIFHACNPWPHEPPSHHRGHQQTKAANARHCRCFPRFGDLSVIDWPMLEIFWRWKLQCIWLENVSILDSLVTFYLLAKMKQHLRCNLFI